MGAFIFYISVATVFFIIGIIILLSGYATEQKPLKLAGVVVIALSLQSMVISFFTCILANYY